MKVVARTTQRREAGVGILWRPIPDAIAKDSTLDDTLSLKEVVTGYFPHLTI